MESPGMMWNLALLLLPLHIGCPAGALHTPALASASAITLNQHCCPGQGTVCPRSGRNPHPGFWGSLAHISKFWAGDSI